MKTLGKDWQSPGRDLNPVYPEYETRVKTTRPQRSEMHSARLLTINNMNVFVTFYIFHSRIKLIKIVKRNCFCAFHDCVNSSMWHRLPFWRDCADSEGNCNHRSKFRSRIQNSVEEQSPPWEATERSATQGIPSLLRTRSFIIACKRTLSRLKWI
jgi:hypothetical protein